MPGPFKATLRWSPAQNADGYKIERAPSNGVSFVEIASLAGNDNTSYDDVGLDAGSTYSWRVRGINALGVGPYSNVIRRDTEGLPSAITDLDVNITLVQ